MTRSGTLYISTGRKIKGKGRGGKIPQGGQKGKIQFQGKKIKFENDEEDGENDTKTGMSFCALNAAYFLQKVAPCTRFSHLAVLCSISVLLTGSALRVLYSIPSRSCPKKPIKIITRQVYSAQLFKTLCIERWWLSAALHNGTDSVS